MQNKKYNFRNSNIILMGDTHSETVTKHLLGKIPGGNDVFHVGDVGLGFGDISFSLGSAKGWLNVFNDYCKKHDIVLYLNRGNHDNPTVWKFPHLSNVILVETGECGVFPNGKKVLFIGGGISVDRFTRTDGVDYWKTETTPFLDNVEECDIVFSHDCPEYFNHPTHSLTRNFGWYVDRDVTLLDDCLKQRNNMSDIVERSKAKQLYSGHFHNSMSDEKNGVKYRCLTINELYEFDSER